jgi:hypothetical protein
METIALFQKPIVRSLVYSIACAAAGRARRARQQGDAPRANSLRLGRVSLFGLGAVPRSGSRFLIRRAPDNALTPLIAGVPTDNYFLAVVATREDEAAGTTRRRQKHRSGRGIGLPAVMLAGGSAEKMEESLIRAATLAGIIAAVILLAVVAGRAELYPNRPIVLVIPLPPGGTNDIMARAVVDKMSDAPGQRIVIENRNADGSGTVGTREVARGP